MAITVTMLQPAGWAGQLVAISGATYTPSAAGVITVAQADVIDAQKAGFVPLTGGVDKAFFNSPLPADLISVVAAANASNTAANALTIAAQPVHARKLQVRIVDDGTHHLTGIVSLAGIDQDGNTISENVTVTCTASMTFKSKYAYAGVTTATSTVTGAGGTTTIGIGVSNDFGVPTQPGAYPTGVSALVCTKSTKITKVLGTSNTAADDDAATTTVDAVARTIAPTTAPASNGLVDFEFSYSWGNTGATAST